MSRNGSWMYWQYENGYEIFRIGLLSVWEWSCNI